MTELFVLTILGTIVAVYSVLPGYRQLRIGYSLGNKVSIAVLGLLGSIVLGGYVGGLVLQHTEQEVLGQITIQDTTLYVDSLFVEVVQLGALVILLGIFLSIFFSGRVRIRNEENLLSTLRDLHNREEYGTLADVLRDNYKPLIDHPQKPSPPQTRYWLDSSIPLNEFSEGDDDQARLPDLFEGAVEEKQPESRWAWVKEKTGEQVDQWRYRGQLVRYRLAETAVNASTFTETLLLDPDFGGTHPILAPGLGIEVISDDSLERFPRRRFTHQYLTALLRAENSLLYREIEQNMASRGGGRYRIDPENRLIHALLSDCERAKDLDVYKPLGDTTKDLLREQGRKEHDQYNDQRLTSNNLSEDYIFSDPIYVSITFFDIMVSEALYQQMRWHMWLYYYDRFTELICENYDLVGESDTTTEWPNDYSRLLYEMASNMIGWIDAAEQIILNDDIDITASSKEDAPPQDGGDDDSQDGLSDAEDTADENSDSESTTTEDQEYKDFIRIDSINTHRGSNIPKSTIICLLSCHKRILTTEAIPDSFKRSLTERILLKCANLRKHDRGSLPWQYSELMIHCLEANLNDRRSGFAYHDALDRVYDDVRLEVTMETAVGDTLIDDLDTLIR